MGGVRQPIKDALIIVMLSSALSFLWDSRSFSDVVVKDHFTVVLRSSNVGSPLMIAHNRVFNALEATFKPFTDFMSGSASGGHEVGKIIPTSVLPFVAFFVFVPASMTGHPPNGDVLLPKSFDLGPHSDPYVNQGAHDLAAILSTSHESFHVILVIRDHTYRWESML